MECGEFLRSGVFADIGEKPIREMDDNSATMLADEMSSPPFSRKSAYGKQGYARGISQLLVFNIESDSTWHWLANPPGKIDQDLGHPLGRGVGCNRNVCGDIPD